MKIITNRVTAALLAGLLILSGCYTTRYLIPPPDLNPRDEGAMDVLLRDGTIYSLDWATLDSLNIYGNGLCYQVDGDTLEFGGAIPISEVELVQVSRPDPLKSLLVNSAVIILMTGISQGATGASVDADIRYPPPPGGGCCPFVFAWDGQIYHFESETFSGAVCRGLERSNLEPLRHLRPVDGAYRLALSNQRDESQYVGELSLLAVDHPPGTSVVPDVAGRIHTVRRLVPPASARDAGGEDVLEQVARLDGRMWESRMEAVDLGDERLLRDGVVCRFEKLEGARQGKLVLNVSNTALSNFAMDVMFSQGGVERLRYHHRLNHDSVEQARLASWFLREGALEVSLWAVGGWQVQGWFPDAGPLVCAEKVIILDISRAKGDTIEVKLESTRDLWRIDRVAIDYSPDEEIAATPLLPRYAVTQSGMDARLLIERDDSLHHCLLPGDHAIVEYDAPAETPGRERSLLLNSRGYYYVWVPTGGWRIDRQTIDRILDEPLYGNRLYLPVWREVRPQYQRLYSSAPRFEAE